MPEPSPTSRQLMLLILISGLFVVVWSTDSGHTETPEMQTGSNSRSAIAVMMQSTAVERPADGVFNASIGDETEIRGEMVVVHSRLAASTWITTSVCGAGKSLSLLVLDEPVEAPRPSQPESPAILIELPIDAPIPATVAFNNPVEAPIPIADPEPVVAPVPPTAAPRLVEWRDRVPVISSVARRAKMDYRMTCHCCREYCDLASRKVAALQRQTRQAVSDLAQSVTQAINGIDWKARLSSEPAEGSQRRF